MVDPAGKSLVRKWEKKEYPRNEEPAETPRAPTLGSPKDRNITKNVMWKKTMAVKQI